MEQLYRWYVLGHWHIALCAVILFIGGTSLSGAELTIDSAVLIFCATLFVYTLHRYVSADRMIHHDDDRYSFVSDHRPYVLSILILSAFFSAFSFFRIDEALQVSIVLLGIISIAYILPLLFSKRLRDMGILKIILISLVWGSLPIIGQLEELAWTSIAFIFIENFCFIFALTIPFDVRDSALDERAKVSNLTNIWSIKRLRTLLVLCLVFSICASAFLFTWGVYCLRLFVSIIALSMFQLLVTSNLEKTRKERFYLLYLDGFILIKGLIYLYFAQCN